jgi:hypothetical protein
MHGNGLILLSLDSQIPTPTGKREFSSITIGEEFFLMIVLHLKQCQYLIPAGIGDIYIWSPSYSEEEVMKIQYMELFAEGLMCGVQSI